MDADIRSSRDIILRTPRWDEALHFYGSVMGLAVIHRSETLVGFETGSFVLYVENGAEHGPVLDFLVADVAAAKARLLSAACTLVEEDSAVPRCYVRDPFGLVFNLGQQDSGR